MDIAGIVVAVLAALAAGASAVYAKGANARADEANRTAKEALDLQARIDEREREFRDVRWHGRWVLANGVPTLRVTNVGLTDACSVTVVLPSPITGARQLVGRFDRVESGEYGDIPIGETNMGEQHNVESLRRMTMLYTAHWSSPLGHVDTLEALYVTDEPPRLS